MLSRRLRRTFVIATFTVASAILPLSDLSAGMRNESRWERPEPVTQRIVRQASSFWNVLVSFWEKAGLGIDGNGGNG
jgi:hypothetical protein